MSRPTFITRVSLVGLGCLIPTCVWADVLPDLPASLWRENEIPSANTFVAIGCVLSAVMIAGGLIATRLFSNLERRRWFYSVLAVLGIVLGGTLTALYRQAQHDSAAWKAWRNEVQGRSGRRVLPHTFAEPTSSEPPIETPTP